MFPMVGMSCCCRRPVTRVIRCSLLIVLLEGLSQDVFAQLPVCHAIRRGESAAQVAHRVTGDGGNAYQAWFQIMNPSSRVVPKSQYDRIRSGWRACVTRPALRSLSSNANHIEQKEAAVVSVASDGSDGPEVLTAATALARADPGAGAGLRLQAAASDVFRRFRGVNLTMWWLGAAIVVSWFVWRIVDDYLTRRKTAAIFVQSFVDRFVDEFERPLLRYDVGERAVRSGLRFGLRRGRFDILLAPVEGRRYPNLSDHRKNVEYDVARVMRVLANGSFVSRAPHAEAEWIVLPFRFTAEPRQSGVSCISSL